METTSDTAWVFDSLVGFLHGPIWNDPLQTFIEEKSLPFEPTENGEVVDRPEYKKIHEEYKNLVDVMLGSFMDDIGISADQFESACRMSARDLAGLPAHFHRRLFDQIWAANDYEIFAKMMTHKNVELQLQALELIERRFGALPSLFSSDNEDLETSISDDSGDWSDKDNVMTEIKRLNLEESDDDVTVAVPPEDMVVEKKTLLSKLQSFEKKEKAATKKLEPSKSVLKKENPAEPGKSSPPPPPPKKVEVSEEDVRARQVYLKQQRDKLLALKKRVREKRLGAAQAEEEAEEVSGSGSSTARPPRPRSARAAVAAMAGAAPAPPPDAMQLRRALATKLKTEVVETKY